MDDDTMIARKYGRPRTGDPGQGCPLPPGEENRDLLQQAQRSGGLGQFRLSRARRRDAARFRHGQIAQRRMERSGGGKAAHSAT